MGPFATRDLWYALGLSGILVGVILLVMALYYLLVDPVKRRQKIMERLEAASEEHLKKVQVLKAGLESQGNRAMAFMKRFLGTGRLSRVQRMLLQADIFWLPSSFLLLVGGLGAAGFFGGFVLLGSLLWGLALMVGLASLPFLYVRRRKKVKTLLFEEQMPDAMELMVRSLRAGHTMPAAIELLSKEMNHPMGSEMRVTYEEQRFGISIPESLLHLLERVESDDLRYFVTAVVIQHEAGGNIVEIIEKIGMVIRSRLNFKAKIRAFTAEGRLSALVLIILPVALFFLLLVIKNEYEGVLLRDELGRRFLIVGVFMLLAGAYVMRRIIRSVEL
ncbi:MAG: hypothetical protein FJ128_00110 [Deltaproteobacteria bacterium]|nr:hypothetical protein [Deltaproteobacteria bacterium]